MYMSEQRYHEEFKIEAVKQVTHHSHSAEEVAKLLGVTSHSVYNQVKNTSQTQLIRWSHSINQQSIDNFSTLYLCFRK
jgi:transposase-like protein